KSGWSSGTRPCSDRPTIPAWLVAGASPGVLDTGPPKPAGRDPLVSMVSLPKKGAGPLVGPDSVTWGAEPRDGWVPGGAMETPWPSWLGTLTPSMGEPVGLTRVTVFMAIRSSY